MEYNRKVHSEIDQTPLHRYLNDKDVGQLRIATRPFGEHDHLNVRQIGNGIQAHTLKGDDAGDDEKQDAHHHQEVIVRAPADDAFDNHFPAHRRGGSAGVGLRSQRIGVLVRV